MNSVCAIQAGFIKKDYLFIYFFGSSLEMSLESGP